MLICFEGCYRFLQAIDWITKNMFDNNFGDKPYKLYVLQVNDQ